MDEGASRKTINMMGRWEAGDRGEDVGKRRGRGLGASNCHQKRKGERAYPNHFLLMFEMFWVLGAIWSILQPSWSRP